MLNGRFMKWLANLHSLEAQRPNASHRVAQTRRFDFKRREPPVEAFVRESLLDEIMGRIARHRIGNQAAFFDKRSAGHVTISYSREGTAAQPCTFTNRMLALG